MTIAIAIAFVVVLWGLSTAVIFYLDSQPARTFPLSMAVASVILVICTIVIWQLAGVASTGAAAASFAAALLAWGWTEMALYMGYLTGPRKKRCDHGCTGPAHFAHAVAANLWHELAVIGFAAAIWFSGNGTALWCFVMLWLMHLSARLNVFLGVRNVSEEFLPEHMEVLKSFLKRRRMNALFPFSIAAHLVLLYQIAQLPFGFETVMAATLAAIGLFEHALLMLPLPIEKLFNWSLAINHPADNGRHTHDAKSRQSHQHTIMGTSS